MQQRYRRPCPRVMQQPVGNMRQFALPIDPGARLVEIEDKFACLQRLAEHCWRRLQRNVGPLPAPVRGQFELAFFIGHQKQARRAVGDVRQCLHHPFLQRDIVEAGGSYGAGEADPLATIVVAVLEQVLDRRNPQPAPQAVGRHPDQRKRTGGDDQSHLRQPRQIAGQHVEPARQREHGGKIAPDQQQREKPEGDSTRRAKLEIRSAGSKTEGEGNREDRSGNAAQDRQFAGHGAHQIGDGEVVEIESP